MQFLPNFPHFAWEKKKLSNRVNGCKFYDRPISQFGNVNGFILYRQPKKNTNKRERKKEQAEVALFSGNRITSEIRKKKKTDI